MQRIIALFLLLSVFFDPVAVGASAEDISARYRMLEWKDLVPEGWEPPLIPPGHDKAETAEVDPAAKVSDLDKQLVTLPGYMKPVVFENNSVSEFLLVPFLPHQVTQHAHLDSNQMVYVSLLEPLQVENPLQPIWVVGTMTLNSVFTDEGAAAYSIVQAVTAEYEY